MNRARAFVVLVGMPSERDKAKRRWWQFSLFSLFLFSAIVPPMIACVMGVFGHGPAVAVTTLILGLGPLVAVVLLSAGQGIRQ